MEKKASLAAAMDWRMEITKETRMQKFRLICMTLKEQWSARCPDGMNMKAIANVAKEYEMKLFNNAKSKDDYLNAGTRKTSGRENHHGSSSCQAAVPNPQYHRPAEPNSLLRQHIQPTPQIHRQNLNVRQTHQQFVMHDGSRVSPQNTLNSQCEPQGFQRRDFGIHLSPEMFTRHPNLVNLQPNENLTTQVKKEVNGFQASKSSHQHHTAIEQHKQQQSMGASAVPEGNPNSEDWLDVAFAEKERLKRTCLPLLGKACEVQVVQTEDIQQHNLVHVDSLKNMMTFLKLPRDKIIVNYNKEKFYRCLRTIEKVGNVIKSNINRANKQQSLHVRQHDLSGYRINPVQQSDNVKLHCQPVIRATTGSSDSSSPIAPREKRSVRLEADCIPKNLLQNKQHSENIKQESQSQWMQLRQNSTGNIPTICRSGMSLKHHLSPKFSPHIHEASQLSQIAQRPLPINPYASSLHGRASPSPSSSIVGPDKSSPNVTYLSSSNFQFPQHCNDLELLHSNTKTQVQSQKIISSTAMTSPFAEPTSLVSNGQLSTGTQAHNRLLKANFQVESLSNEELIVAVSGISSIAYMEDAITDPWFHAKATDLRLLDGCGSSNNMKRKINAMALNDIPSPCSDITGSEPTVTSSRKKLKKLSDYALLEEMRNINKQFIETVLELDLDENLNRRLANAGTVLRCSYSAVTDSENSEVCPVKVPVLSVKLLVPLDYPEDYPVFLSKFNTDSGNVDEEFRDLSNEATSMLRAFLRTAPECLSLEEYARVWDECARSVVSEYAQRAGGGCFSHRYGTWEDSVTAA